MHKIMARTCIALAFVLAQSVDAQTDRTDEFIAAEMKRQGIPGLALVVVKEGSIVKAKGYGFANIKAKTPVTPQTVFKIGSVSKQFIATGIMLLVGDGRLRVDDPVGKYLDGAPASWSGITVRHLLTHTGGLVREAPGFSPSRVQSDADVIRSAYGTPVRFAPGEKWEYSNTGYFILAEIIHKVSGQPWDVFVTERVFRPAGMNATHPTNTKTNVPGRATGYADNDNPKEAAEWRALRPSGAFLSTVLDLARWDAMLYTDSILPAATRQEMWTPVTLNDGRTHGYGFGWELGSRNGRRYVHHGGALPGFLSEFARYVDDRVTVAVLINLGDGDVEAIANGVAALHLPPTARQR
jgi:CubicO group peptidase (beta-lactamase class C family)